MESTGIEISTESINREYIDLCKFETFICNYKERNDKQRTSFKNKMNSLDDKTAMLLMDFKENIKIGGSAREVSSIFYSKSQRTYFTILVILRGIKFHYFDFISEDLSHNSSFVIKALDYLFHSDEWKQFKIENISIWSDGARHFKNFELIHYETSLIKSGIAKSVNFNYFIEYHGKSYCDSHFAVVSRILKDHERTSEMIKSTSELIEMLKRKFDRYDSIYGNDTKRRRIPTNVTIVEIKSFLRAESFETCDFNGLKFYYSFDILYSNPFAIELFGSITHGDTYGKRIPLKLRTDKRDPKPPKKAHDVPTSDIKFSNYLWKKEQERAKIQKKTLPEPTPMIVEETVTNGTYLSFIQPALQFTPMEIE
jgi:hypothetical protein